jgi:hypothetical protein
MSAAFWPGRAPNADSLLADNAWLCITMLTVGHLISLGSLKAAVASDELGRSTTNHTASQTTHVLRLTAAPKPTHAARHIYDS